MEKKRISELENRTMEFNQHEQQKEDRMQKRKKNEQSLSVLWDNNKRSITPCRWRRTSRWEEAELAPVARLCWSRAVASCFCLHLPCMWEKSLNTEVARATTDLGWTVGCPRFGSPPPSPPHPGFAWLRGTQERLSVTWLVGLLEWHVRLKCKDRECQ